MIPVAKPSVPNISSFPTTIITNGPSVQALEKAVEKFTGVKHAIAVSSCTSGLMLVLKAMNIKGEVILPSYTFGATGLAPKWNGCTLKFVDCLPGVLTIDPKAVQKAITKKTKAIIGVNIFGVPPDYDLLKKVAGTIPLIYDSAQGLGSSYKGKKAGNFGAVEVFSMSPTKGITAIEGGIITTNNASLAKKLRSLRDYGKGKDGLEQQGMNARMSEYHALVGLKNMNRASALLKKREQLVKEYKKHLSFPMQHIPSRVHSSWNYFVIFPEKREEVEKILKEAEVETKRYFFPPLHQQPLFYQKKSLPITEKYANNSLALPLFYDLTSTQVKKICSLLKK